MFSVLFFQIFSFPERIRQAPNLHNFVHNRVFEEVAEMQQQKPGPK